MQHSPEHDGRCPGDNARALVQAMAGQALAVDLSGVAYKKYVFLPALQIYSNYFEC